MSDNADQETSQAPAGSAEAEEAGPAAQAEAPGATTEEPQDEDAPGEYLHLGDAQRVTHIWKVEHQHIGVQQMGAVHGGQTYGAGTATVAAERTGADRAGSIRGRIRPSELERIRRIYTRTSVHDWADAVLDEHGLVILHGRARWGKTTTALRLLDEKHRDEIYVLDPASPLDAPEKIAFEEKQAYLVEQLAPAIADNLILETLIYLSERLLELKSHLVITVDGLVPLRQRALRRYLVPCEELPDPELVLTNSLKWRLRDSPHGIEEVERTRPEWVHKQLKGPLVPSRVDGLASILERVARKQLKFAEAATAYRSLLAEQVAEWFETHPGLRQRCLMVAIALLNEGSYQEVADAAERLRERLEPPPADEDEPRGSGWQLTSSRRRRVQDCCADLVPDLESTEIGDIPIEVVHLEDPHLQPAVLEHVWREHDVVRQALLGWLEELGEHPSLSVSSPIAAAVGSLSQNDFRYFHDRLFSSWAAHENRNVRWSAAVALDVLATAGKDSETRVRQLLHHWVSSNPRSAMAWTAVAAYGFEIGQRDPNAALADVLLVVRSNPLALWVAGRTMANLCDVGLAAVALEELTSWSERRNAPQLQERSLRVFLHATAAGSALAPGPQRSWPVLLRVTGHDDHRAKVTALWRGALVHDRLERWASDALRRWFDRAEDKPELKKALDGVIADLLRPPGRAQSVVRRLLDEWANDPVRPSTLAKRYLQQAAWKR